MCGTEGDSERTIADLAGCKGMRAESVTGFVVVRCARIVIEYPPRVLRPTRLVRKSPDFFIFAVPKPAHPAMPAVLLPQVRVDMALAIERRYEFIAMARGAHRKLLGSSKFEPDALEHVGQRHERAPCKMNKQANSPFYK